MPIHICHAVLLLPGTQPSFGVGWVLLSLREFKKADWIKMLYYNIPGYQMLTHHSFSHTIHFPLPTPQINPPLRPKLRCAY